MKDGEDFCGVAWVSEPVDGFLCLVGTQRTLDVDGHCCDYDRCAATQGRLRCVHTTTHEGAHHVGFNRYWPGAGVSPSRVS